MTPPWLRSELRERLVVVLLRHGRTAWNAEGRFLGDTDLELDDVGVTEVARLGRVGAGSFHRVYCSPLRRARRTAEALAPPDPVPVDALRELGQGALEGLTRREALAAHGDFFEAFARDPASTTIPGGGGSFAQLQDRAFDAIQQIASAHRPGERVAVVTHQMVIAAVACRLVGVALRDWRDYALPNTGAVVVGWDGAHRLSEHQVVERGWIAPEDVDVPRVT